MGYIVVWSTLAEIDLSELVRYIARDNPERAASFGQEIIDAIEQTALHPEMG